MPRRMEILKEIIDENGYKKIVEVGVHDGRTSTYLLKNCPSLEKCWGVDIYLRCEITDPRFEALEMSSVDASAKFEDGSVDLVFIDADHDYEPFVQDLEHWKPKVRAGGTLSGHDYGNGAHLGIQKAVDERFKKDKKNFRVVSSGNSPNDNVWLFKIPDRKEKPHGKRS